MGLESQLKSAGYDIGQVRLVDARGRRVGGFSTHGLHRLTHGRFTSVPRGAIARLIYDSMVGQVQTVFAVQIDDIVVDDSGAIVVLDNGMSRRFDLVVGAGGVHSVVRRLVFGPDTRFERDLGYRVAVFDAAGYLPRDELVYVSHSLPGRMVSRFALRQDRTMFLMMFGADRLQGLQPHDRRAITQALRHVFDDAGWECPEMLAALDRADEVYFDRVSQIVMDRWSAGPVMLVGHAAAAVSLLAGEGTGLAILQAYVLAGELGRAGGDYRRAFANHEQMLRSLIAGKQASAHRFATAFAAATPLGVWLRNYATRLLALPCLGERIMGRELRDDFTLPHYAM